MKSLCSVVTIKRIALSNIGLALFGTPIAYLFISTLAETALINAIGVVFVFVSIFLTMTLGLDLFMKNSHFKVDER